MCQRDQVWVTTSTVNQLWLMSTVHGVYMQRGRLEAVREGVRLDLAKVRVISIMSCLYAGGADNQPQ